MNFEDTTPRNVKTKAFTNHKNLNDWLDENLANIELFGIDSHAEILEEAEVGSGLNATLNDFATFYVVYYNPEPGF